MAETDVTKTTQPCHDGIGPRACSSMKRAASCVRKYGPLRLTRSRRSKLSSPASSTSARSDGATPALLTSTCEPAEALACGVDQPPASGRLADVGLHVDDLAAEPAQRGQRVGDGRFFAGAADEQVEAVPGEAARDAEADAARPARDEGDAAAHRSAGAKNV